MTTQTAPKAHEPRLCGNCSHTHRMAHRAVQDQIAHRCSDCDPCRRTWRNVRVVNADSTFLGMRGRIRSVHDSGTVMVLLDGWDLDLPFGESEIEEERGR